MVIVLGLTGSIGMGKSTVLAMFAELGLPTFDADAAVHAVYAKGGAAVGPVGDRFPSAIRGGAVDRTALSGLVLGDPAALAALEAIVHPLVQAERQTFVAKAERAGAAIAVIDVPLLFETGGEADVDRVVVVSAPAETQRRRVLARPGMTAEKFEAILARQVSDAEKRARADHVIDTGQSLEGTRKDVENLVRELAPPHPGG